MCALYQFGEVVSLCHNLVDLVKDIHSQLLDRLISRCFLIINSNRVNITIDIFIYTTHLITSTISTNLTCNVELSFLAVSLIINIYYTCQGRSLRRRLNSNYKHSLSGEKKYVFLTMVRSSHNHSLNNNSNQLNSRFTEM